MDRKSDKAGIWMDTPERYGLVSRAFHWLMAYLLIWQFTIITASRVFGRTELLKAIAAYGPYHGTVGLLTIVLVTLRAAWALLNAGRRPPHEPGWPGRIALAGHVGLYLLMFVIPAVAILRAYGRGKGWTQWGIQIVPATGEEVAWMTAPANALHGVLAWLLCLLIAGHIAMALHHRLIRRDRILARMAGRLRTVGGNVSRLRPGKELSEAA